MNGKGILFLPGEVVIRGTFRNDRLHGKAFIMVGGQTLLLCDYQNGTLAGEMLRVQLDAGSSQYYAINLRTEKFESM